MTTQVVILLIGLALFSFLLFGVDYEMTSSIQENGFPVLGFKLFMASLKVKLSVISFLSWIGIDTKKFAEWIL